VSRQPKTALRPTSRRRRRSRNPKHSRAARG
jgi:hypothetical protein